jgi:hypothetical protein
MGLGASWLGKQTTAFWIGEKGPLNTLAFFAAALPLYLAGAFGARLVGLPSLLRSIARPPAAQPLRLCLAVFALSGPLLSLLFSVTPAGYDVRTSYNDAVWFFVQSKYVVWIFAVEVVLALSGARLRAWAAALLMAVSLPSTIEFLHHQATGGGLLVLGAEERGLIDFFRGGEARCIALARPPIAQALLAMTPCEAPALTVFPMYAMPRSELEARVQALEAFWSAWNAGRLDPGPLATYGITHVVVDAEQDRAAAPPGSAAETFRNRHYAVYRLAAAASAR